MNAATLPVSNPVAPPAGAAVPVAADRHAAKSFSFGDFLSIFNPLQHIPIVGTIYRAMTGDTIHPFSRAMGGALFGGPIGFASAIAGSVVESATGKDVGDHALALLNLGPDEKAPAPDATMPNTPMMASAGFGGVEIARPVPPVQWAGFQTVPLQGQTQFAQAAPPPAEETAPHKINWMTERQVAAVDPEFIVPQAPAILKPPGTETRLAQADGRQGWQTVPLRKGMDPGVAATGAQLHMANAQQGMPQNAGAGTPQLRGVPLAYQQKSNLSAAARFSPPVPNPPMPEKPLVLTPANGTVAVAAPIAPQAPPSGPWFLEAMSRGLDRYGDAMRQPTGSRVDVSR